MDISTNLIFDIQNSDISNNRNYAVPLLNIFENILSPPPSLNNDNNTINTNPFNLFQQPPLFQQPLQLNNIFPNIFNNNNNNNVLNNSLYEKNSYKNILSSKGRKLLKELKYNKNTFKCINCPILQIPFEEGQDIIQLPCKHIFDKNSILQWLEEEQSKCPICRYELPYDEIKIKKDLITDITDISNNDSSNNVLPRLSRRNNIDFLQNAFNMVANRIEQEDLQQALINSMSDNNTDLSDNDITVD